METKKQPKFIVPTWEIDPFDPWKGTESNGIEFVQLYVFGAFKEIECIAEIIDLDIESPDIGNCFDLHGKEIILSLEEREEALKDWMKSADKFPLPR